MWSYLVAVAVLVGCGSPKGPSEGKVDAIEKLVDKVCACADAACAKAAAQEGKPTLEAWTGDPRPDLELRVQQALAAIKVCREKFGEEALDKARANGQAFETEMCDCVDKACVARVRKKAAAHDDPLQLTSKYHECAERASQTHY